MRSFRLMWTLGDRRQFEIASSITEKVVDASDTTALQIAAMLRNDKR